MKNKMIKKLLLILIIGIFISTYGFSLAKYVSNSFWDFYLRTQNFYFYSDTLNIHTYKYADNSWDGSSIEFNVRNNLNERVITTYDINYDITCTIENEASSYTECRLNGTESNTFSGTLSGYKACVNYTEDQVDVSSFDENECDLGGYDWEYQISTKDFYFDVELTDLEYEIEYVKVKVIAESTSPYNKKLIGEYFLNKSDINNEVTLKYYNYSNYDRLVITNPNNQKTCMKLSWNSDNLLIDSNEYLSYITDENDYINEIMLEIDEFSSNNYIFYSRDFNEIYSVEDFSINYECDGEPLAPLGFIYPDENLDKGETITVEWDETSSWGSETGKNYRLEVSYDEEEYELVANTGTTSSYEYEISSTANNLQFRVRTENSLEVSNWTYSGIFFLQFICGDLFIDSRDDFEYPTVEIGDQCWFAHDLMYNDEFSTTWNGEGVRTKGSPYQDTGMLYQFDAAMDGSTTEGAQGLCPKGWYIPSNNDWDDLFDEIGGTNQANKLKCDEEYNDGTNETGFTAIPGGYYDMGGTLHDASTHSYWWSSSSPITRYWIYQGWGSVATSLAGANDGFAVRCLMDEES